MGIVGTMMKNVRVAHVGRIAAVGLALSGLVWLLTPAFAARITNEPTGFNGYRWGAGHAEYPALKLLSDPAAASPLKYVEVYERPDEVVTLNGVTFNKVHYRFHKDRLGNVQLWYEGKENREKLIQWIEAQYGKLPFPERKQKQIEWHGQDTIITLDYDFTNSKGRLWFTNLLFSPFDNSSTDTTGY